MGRFRACDICGEGLNDDTKGILILGTVKKPVSHEPIGEKIQTEFDENPDQAFCWKCLGSLCTAKPTVAASR